MLKHLITFISSTLLLLATPQPCTLDLTPNTADLFYEDEKLNPSIEYDQGSNTKGKLTKISDSSGSLAFTYDAKGNLGHRGRVMLMPPLLLFHKAKNCYNNPCHITQESPTSPASQQMIKQKHLTMTS